MINTLLGLLANVYAALHCLLRHGAGPVRSDRHGRFVLACPACGRVFWREHARA